MAVTYSDADNVLRWTAERLLADDQPAYGSIHQGDDQHEPPTRKGTVYALPRRRYVLDWRKACAGADIC